jgi:hypothetical protein
VCINGGTNETDLAANHPSVPVWRDGQFFIERRSNHEPDYAIYPFFGYISIQCFVEVNGYIFSTNFVASRHSGTAAREHFDFFLI